MNKELATKEEFTRKEPTHSILLDIIENVNGLPTHKCIEARFNCTDFYEMANKSPLGIGELILSKLGEIHRECECTIASKARLIELATGETKIEFHTRMTVNNNCLKPV